MREILVILVALFVAVLIFYGLAAAVNNGNFDGLTKYGWIGFWIWMVLGALVGLRVGVAIAEDE